MRWCLRLEVVVLGHDEYQIMNSHGRSEQVYPHFCRVNELCTNIDIGICSKFYTWASAISGSILLLYILHFIIFSDTGLREVSR